MQKAVMGNYTKSIILLVLVLLSPNVMSSSLSYYRLVNCSSSGYQSIQPSLVIDSANNLYLLYKETSDTHDRLIFKQKGWTERWANDKQVILTVNNSQQITSYPEPVLFNDQLFIAYSIYSESNTSLVVTTKLLAEKNWSICYYYGLTDCKIKDPLIRVVNDSLFLLCWIDDHTGKDNIYFQKYFNDTGFAGEKYQLAVAENKISEIDLAIYNDKLLFSWECEINDLKNVHLSIVTLDGLPVNGSLLINGPYDYQDPNIIVNEYNQPQLFWSNYTDPTPEMLGTYGVYSSIKNGDNWSQTEKVAPILPPDRFFMKADASNPYAIVDHDNNLWLAYELREAAGQFQGVGIRGRKNGLWEKQEPISLGIAIGFDPHIVSDSESNIHCVWSDFRTYFLEIYYRVRYYNNTWSNEFRLTEYSSQEVWTSLGKAVLIIGGLVTVMVVVMTSVHYLKERRIKKYIEKEDY
jgi:hypothetical protein